MAKIKIEEKLDRLAEIRSVSRSLLSDMEETVEQALRNSEMKEVYEEIKMHLERTQEMEAETMAVIKEAVIKTGESVKGELLQAVFSKGRTTWDTKALEGYAVAHPEILALKKTGEPSVSIRDIKEAKKE